LFVPFLSVKEGEDEEEDIDDEDVLGKADVVIMIDGIVAVADPREIE
jgi:hypothetical protein